MQVDKSQAVAAILSSVLSSQWVGSNNGYRQLGLHVRIRKRSLGLSRQSM